MKKKFNNPILGGIEKEWKIPDLDTGDPFRQTPEKARENIEKKYKEFLAKKKRRSK